MSASAAPTIALRTPIRHIGYNRPRAGAHSTLGGFPGKTFGCLHQLPANAVGVQFELANLLTGSHTTYNAAYAISAGVNDWGIPVNGSGQPDNTLWVPITLGGSTAMVVPPASSEVRPARVLTDIMPFTTPPLTRTDGGSGILIFFRLCSTDKGATVMYGFDPNGIFNGFRDMQDPTQHSQTYGGGFALSNANICVPGAFGLASSAVLIASRYPVAVPYAVRPSLAGGCLTVMSIGDSILDGRGSASGPGNAMSYQDQGIDGPGHQLATMLDSPLRPAFHHNGAASGQSSSDFYANGAITLGLHMPDVLLLQVYSANDSFAATLQAAWNAYRAGIQLASTATRGGARVILVTSPPFSGPLSVRPASVWEATRVAANGWVRASGLPYVDCDLLVGTGDSDPGAYQQWATPDQIHLGAEGAKVIAEAAAKILASDYDLT